MLCESCKKADATIHLTQVADGAVKKLHLCEACAAKSGFDLHGPMSITDILLGAGASAPEESRAVRERSCPRCHMRRADFKKTSRMGCPVCYETFAEELPALLKAIHRSDQHAGKIPARESKRVHWSAELAALERRLKEAVAGEAFEEAARLRDQIRLCQSRMAEDEAAREP